MRKLAFPALKTKLAPPTAAAAPSARTSEPVTFICNFLNSKTENKIGAEIDDDTYLLLHGIGEQFGKDESFKYPIRKGQGQYEGRYFVDLFVDKELSKTVDIQDYLREQIVVVGKAIPYHFTPKDGEADISGWKIVMTSICLNTSYKTPTLSSKSETE